ncbi:polyphosphate kinase 1 [Geomonas sp. Red69]|uniref:Polyphosphate kinase n=1 Tax=Geomonas diazotrophica TaxID=2843197 RepID=A0ABX8JIT1_9BACT|nr:MULTISPECIES: polyphosphate kinase 1 [Geomonas]MBU5637854.1 polyphosphate kinase 1 [Geomonas diazotrophica]QWV96567.1 polyphosphate kinase 1 [Geomonas nitrogeniifigens]
METKLVVPLKTEQEEDAFHLVNEQVPVLQNVLEIPQMNPGQAAEASDHPLESNLHFIEGNVTVLAAPSPTAAGDPQRPKGAKQKALKQEKGGKAGKSKSDKVSKGKVPKAIKSSKIAKETKPAKDAKAAKATKAAKASKPGGVKPKAAKATKPGAKQPPKPKSPAVAEQSEFDLGESRWYLNRELTWLEFNRRVLHEAVDERTPLLERLKFIAIVSSNLDEFAMKRIGGLKQQIGAGLHELTLDGRTPRQQVVECNASVREIEAAKREAFRQVRELLEAKGIVIESYDTLTPKEKKQLREHYYTNIYPLLTPQSIDPAHPFPFISNLSLNLLVTLRYPKSREHTLARVKVPIGLGTPRFIRVGKGDHFIPIEQVMMNNLDMLFPGMLIVSCEIFRVTRNANTEKDEEEADDLMSMIESELKERKFAPIVRLEVGEGMEPLHRGRLAAELELDEENDVLEVSGMLALRDLFEISKLDYPRLHDPPHHPIDHPQLPAERNIFHTIRDLGAILLQHPYVSFSTSVERFLREAANDPKVRAIKMTLYRTSIQGRIIDALVQAAQNGKQVAVVVELKARFDEATNIHLAEVMEEAGIHVTYGVVGLKTHCKVILVVRQDFQGLRRYVHIGTGNYHTETARIYSDMGIITCDDVIAQDVTELFNYLTTGFTAKRNYRAVMPAPKLLKKALLTRIEREVELHRQTGGGLIRFKMNALEDGDIVKALYRASMAGVKVDLYVRDTCRLRPGIPGLSDNIRVASIVGRFLEHSRIYYFRNGGAEEYFISSADAMKRNLEARVEVLCPVTAPELTTELRTVLDCHDADHRSAWDMQSDGSYVQRQPTEGESGEGTHQMLIAQAQQRLKDALKQKKKPMQK